MHPNDVILQTVTKVLAFIIVIFSFYVFLAVLDKIKLSS